MLQAGRKLKANACLETTRRLNRTEAMPKPAKAKKFGWCTDPRHGSPCTPRCPACQTECNHKFFFNGTLPETEALLETNKQAARTTS